MVDIERNPALRAPRYERPLHYTYDRSLGDGGSFRYVYDNGEVRCSQPLSSYVQLCRMAPEEMNAIRAGALSFVYLDAGRWGDGCVSFGIVSGRDVYLCDYIPGERWSDDQVPSCRNESVGNLLTQLWALNNGVKVLQYAEAQDVSPQTASDNHIYILIPDCHLPPISWYFENTRLFLEPDTYVIPTGIMAPGTGPVIPPLMRPAPPPFPYREPPVWFRSTGPYQRHTNLYQAWYGQKMLNNSRNRPPHRADIFGSAGDYLVRFLNSLTRVSTSLLAKIHVISLGDMFELWLNREYQFEPGDNYHAQPHFIGGGEGRTADWAAEVMLWNMEVIEAWRALERAGAAEVFYIWGNHEAYLMSPAVTSQLSLRPRRPQYTGLNGDLHVEHGHRFDSANFDNVSDGILDYKGPFWANKAYWFPWLRKAEPIVREDIPRILANPTEREIYFAGASLVYLNQKFDQRKKPFSIFCMGHTHGKYLCTFNITGQYSLWGNTE